MRIEPTYVSYEQAKLLKEKGFDIYCTHGYFEHGDTQLRLWLDGEPADSALANAPEQWQVCEGLRINFGIWVSINIAIDGKWYFELYDLKDKRNAEILINDESITDFYPSPQEAYSAAFGYLLKELI
jgi:hypothetical protein